MPPMPIDEPRRRFLRGIGKGSVFFAFLLQFAAAARALVPNVLYEPSRRFRTRKPGDYPQGVTFEPAHQIFVVREEDSYRALSATCTHLGCTPNWLESAQKFKCPCHGSGFYISGINFEGPAPRPLERWSIYVGDDGQLVVDKSKKFQQERGEWTNPESFIKV